MIKNCCPCGTLPPTNDHYNDIKLYTHLTIHVVSNNSNSGYAKTYSPYSTLHSMKDHYIDIKLYTPLTIHFVSNDDVGLAKTYGPCSTYSMKDHFNDIELYTP